MGPTLPRTAPKAINTVATQYDAPVKLDSTISIVDSEKSFEKTLCQNGWKRRYNCTTTALMKKVYDSADHA